MKKNLFIISLIVLVVLTSCQKSQQDRLLERVRTRVETIQNSDAEKFCCINSGVSSGKVYIDTLGIFSKDQLIEFEKFKEYGDLNGRYLEGKWHSFEWKSLGGDSFSILRDTIHYYSNGNDFVICDMVVPMSGQGYRIKNITYEWACDFVCNSILFEVEYITEHKIITKRLLPGATELTDAEGWTNLRQTKDGDCVHHEVDWFENGKRVSTHTFKTQIINWPVQNGWSNQRFAVHGGAIEYQVNWYKDGEIVKRFAENITSKKLPIAEWENLN